MSPAQVQAMSMVLHSTIGTDMYCAIVVCVSARMTQLNIVAAAPAGLGKPLKTPGF